MARLIALLLFGTLAVGGTAGVYYYISDGEDQQQAETTGTGSQTGSSQEATSSQSGGGSAATGAVSEGSSSGSTTGSSGISDSNTGSSQSQSAATPSAQSGDQTATSGSGDSETTSSGTESQQQTAALPKAEDQSSSSQSTSDTAAAASRFVPSFDVVRIEKDGSTVMAGRAAPGAEVEITLNGQSLGRVTANAQGEWVFLPDQPLPEGDHELSLSGSVAGGQKVLSENVLVVAVPKSSPTKDLSQAAEDVVSAGKEVVEDAAAALDKTMADSSQDKVGTASATQMAATAPSSLAAGASETASSEQGSSQSTAAAQGSDSGSLSQGGDQAGSGSNAQQLAQASGSVSQGNDSSGNTSSSSQALTTSVASGTSETSASQSGETEASGTTSGSSSGTVSASGSSVTTSTTASDTAASGSDSQNETQQNNEEVVAVLVPRDGGGTTKVLQGPETGLASGNLVLDSITYDDAGVVSFAGRVEGNGTIFIYVDNALAAKATGQAGVWQAKGDGPVALGLHRLRVDQVAEDGSVLARVETPFARTNLLTLPSEQDRMVVVQPGNSLWRIARRVYGQGVSYSVVFEANRDQIADPHLIYPGQIFVVPDKS
ncbi:LysM peptidoglycan-binding domain-containing protein [Rhodovibrionaceae bacterium A322]